MSLEGDNWVMTLNGSTNVTFNTLNGSLDLEAIPEPGTWALLGGGMLLVEWLRRRKAA